MNKKTVVVLGCSQWRDYSVLLPITCLFWREVVGYESISLLVEDEKFWMSQHKRCKASLKALKDFAFDHVFIGNIKDREHSTIAQSARQHCAALPLDEELWLMMSDADLWPLKKDFYHTHGSNPIQSLYSNGNHYQDLPTCHITMQVKTWREVMQINPDFGLRNTLEVVFMNSLPEDGFKRWCFDQFYCTEKIKASKYWKEGVEMIERPGHPPVDRIDRGNVQDWTSTFQSNKWTDAHLLKAPEENWAKIRPVVEALIPQHLDWADKYISECL